MSEQETIEQLRAHGYSVTAPSSASYSNYPTREEIAALEKRLDRIEARSGLMSKNFINRAFSVWGYFFFAQLMIGIGAGLIIVIIGVLGG